MAKNPVMAKDPVRTDSGAPTPLSLRLGIVALAAATAIIHLVVAPTPDGGVIFYFNALGYIALVTALFLPPLRRYHRLLRWLLMGYTALTIVLWALLGMPYTALGYVDKAIELGLLGLLWIDHRRSVS